MNLDDSRTTRDLLDAAKAGDAHARERLLAQHRHQLSRMVAARLDTILCARVDPSDVVQDALAAAALRLDQYLAKPTIAFYPWLRGFAWDRLIDLRRRHVTARRRSVLLEHALNEPLADGGTHLLGDHLLSAISSPSEQMVREETRHRVFAALQELSDVDREVLILRYIEQLSTSEIADVTSLSVRTVQLRHARALQKLRPLLETPAGDSQ